MSSAQSQSSSMSRAASQACLDPLDSLIDFSEYEQVSYQSPSLSPSTSSKPQFVRPVASTPTTNNALSLAGQQTLSGPSHPYEMHKQQTGIPQGGLATTLALNQSQMYGYGFMSGLSPTDDFVDFNTAPSSTSFPGLDMDMEYDSPSTEPAFFFPPLQSSTSSSTSTDFVNPSNISGQEGHVMPTVLSSQTSNVGRMWPGAHQQQALAKAQLQQKQQQRLIQQQRQNSNPAQQHQRSKSRASADPIVEEKISQLLNSMRQNSVAMSEADDAITPGGSGHSQRSRKEEEDMDEDERLLASEEGKKLSSKERRQLRNKVSARAFRSRRKEYITQLEGEIQGKVNENNDLRARNRALMEENQRLSDLTRMLLSSPSFSGFLDTLSSSAPAPQQQTPAPQAPTPVEQRPVQKFESRQSERKDVNPYQQQLQNQQINFAILPEQPIDFSMLDLNQDTSFIYQPQVYSVLELPEVKFDTSILSGKSSNFVGPQMDSNVEKIDVKAVEHAPIVKEAVTEVEPVADDEFDSDPTFALFAASTFTATVTLPSPAELEDAPIFGSIGIEKALARYEIVLPSPESEDTADAAMTRVQRIWSCMEAVTARLEALTVDL